MYYINSEEQIFPKEVFIRFSEKKRKTFKEITDVEYNELMNNLNKGNKTFLVENEKIKYIEMNPNNDLIIEKMNLQSFLNKSDYVEIKYGSLGAITPKRSFLQTYSDTFEMTNAEIFAKRIEARKRIKELREIINA